MPSFDALHVALRDRGWRRRGNAWHREDTHVLRVRTRGGDEWTGHQFVLRYEPWPDAPHPALVEGDLWFAYSPVEQRQLLAHQRDVLTRHRGADPEAVDLRLEGFSDESLHVGHWFVFYNDAEREEWAERLVDPVVRAVGVIWSREG